MVIFWALVIELPWIENKKQVSCIPEGVYELKPRFSEKFKHHLAASECTEKKFDFDSSGQ